MGGGERTIKVIGSVFCIRSHLLSPTGSDAFRAGPRDGEAAEDETQHSDTTRNAFPSKQAHGVSSPPRMAITCGRRVSEERRSHWC